MTLTSADKKAFRPVEVATDYHPLLATANSKLQSQGEAQFLCFYSERTEESRRYFIAKGNLAFDLVDERSPKYLPQDNDLGCWVPIGSIKSFQPIIESLGEDMNTIVSCLRSHGLYMVGINPAPRRLYVAPEKKLLYIDQNPATDSECDEQGVSGFPMAISSQIEAMRLGLTNQGAAPDMDWF